MTVWLIESGEYEQRGVWGVADSVVSAVEFIKQKFPPPHQVSWDEPVQLDDDTWRLTGAFGAVQYYSIEHENTFDITKYEVYDGHQPLIVADNRRNDYGSMGS